MVQREFPSAPVLGVGAIVFDCDRLLLVKRANPPLAGQWSLPGGVVELGETLEAACVREVLEETGLEIDVIARVDVVERIALHEDSRIRYHFVLIDYLCKLVSGEICAASDAVAVRWVAWEDVNNGAFPISSFTLDVVRKAHEMLQS